MGIGIAVGGALLGAAKQSRDRRKAGRQQREGIQKAMGSLEDSQGRALNALEAGKTAALGYLSPYQGIGAMGMQRLGGIGNFNYDPRSIKTSPAYNFRMNQGLEALDRRLGAGGFRGSGNRITGIMDYAQGLASQEYAADYNRKFNEYTTNYGIGMGMTQFGAGIAGSLADISNTYGTNVAGLESQYGANLGQLQMGHAESLAGQTMDRANIFGQAAGYTGGMIGSYMMGYNPWNPGQVES